jgi:capsular polysaccharide transport system permease protein
MTQPVRTPWQVTRSVWYALFMREALSRTTADRFGWFWMVFEPAAMIILMVLIRTIASNGLSQINGAEFIPWFVVGLFGFFLYRENMMRLIGAVEANKALFAYRQVKPIDTVLVRSFVEAILKTFVFMCFMLVGWILGIDFFPFAPIEAFYYWFILWGMGLGSGLVISAGSSFFPEIGKIVRILSLPLLITSGVLFPISFLPQDIKEIVLMNPIVHGVELLRYSFFDGYYLDSEVSVIYLSVFVLMLINIGIMMHLSFEKELKAK